MGTDNGQLWRAATEPVMSVPDPTVRLAQGCFDMLLAHRIRHHQRLATGALAAQSALPVASPAATPDTAAGMGSAAVGKVTPVRDEHGQQDGSGQEENHARF
jgi:hypothetical protein